MRIKTLPKLNMQQKQQNQQILQRINRKIDFKKNPRYETKNMQKYTDILTQQETITNAADNQGPFRCDPPFIRFQNYKKDNLYEFQINVVNVSKITRRIKVAPLKSKQFTISEIKYPNSNTGDIASGLSAKINIRFYPNHMTDFSQELIILSESNIVKVPILAKLQQPNLNIPKIIDCGNCWVGDVIKTKYELINKGGQTNFRIQHEKGIIEDGSLKINNFYIFPIEATLKKNQKITIYAKYEPKIEGRLQQILYLNYDNEHKIPLSIAGAGYSAELKVLQLNGISVNQQLQKYKIYFSDVYPNEVKQSIIKIKNLATVNLSYLWKIKNKSFTINSIKDVFKPLEQKQFTISFLSPQNIPIFQEAQLYLQQIPAQSLKNRFHQNSKTISQLIYYKFQMITCPNRYQIDVSPPCFIYPQKIEINKLYKNTFVLGNKYNSDIQYKVELYNQSNNCFSKVLNEEGIIPKLSKKQIQIEFTLTQLNNKKKMVFKILFKNANPIYLTIQAIAKPPELTLQNYSLDFGLIKQNSTVSKNLKFTNFSSNTIQFNIQNIYKYHYPQYSEFYQFDQQSIQSLKKRLEIDHQNVTLNPGQSKEIKFTYNALKKQTFNQKLFIRVINGKQYQIEVFVEVQQIHLILSKGYINFKDIYVGNTYSLSQISRRNPLMLINLGNIDAQFNWENVNNNTFDIQITPSKGIIKAKTKIQIQMVLKPLRSTNLNYILKCSNIFLQKNLELHIQGQMKGLQIIYYQMNQSLAKRIKIKQFKQDMTRTKSKKVTTLTHTSNLTSLVQKQKIVYPNLQKIQFYNCEINKPKQMFIILQNISDLNTEFQIQAEIFKAVQKQQKNNKTKGALLSTNTLPFNSEMGKTMIANRMLQKLQKSQLSNNKGVSILCQPSRGQLLKNSQIRIKLTLFNDICGHFQDKLKINIKDHEIKIFPIEIDIRGTPVCISKNQIGIDFANQYPIYKLGVFPQNSGTIKKQFKVINNGPKPVDISWKIYPSKISTERNIFNIKIQEPQFGSNDILKVKWQALEPPQQINSVFVIQPKNKIIQGRQQSTFIVSYRTSQEQKIQRSILIGEPYLISQNNKIKMQLLPIITQAQSVFPKLSMDVQHNNYVTKFERFAGLINQQKNKRTVILQNLTDANLIFTLDVQNKFFTLTETKTNTLNTNNLVGNSSFNSSKGMLKNTKQIQKSFNLVPKSHVQVTINFEVDQKNLEVWPITKSNRIQGKLNIEFSNGKTQFFPLLGQLLRPHLILNTTGIDGKQGQKIIDFGIVHTKNSKNIPIYLINTSSVKAIWSLKYVKYPTKKSLQPILWTKLDKQDQDIIDQKQIFQFSKTQGNVESLTIPLRLMPSTLALPSPDDKYCKTHIPQKILINFKPKKNALYKSKYRIIVQSGQIIQFIVKGMGTYDEEKQL